MRSAELQYCAIRQKQWIIDTTIYCHATQIGIRWTSEWRPYTLIGDASWADYYVSADVLVETNGGLAFVMGRVGSVPRFSDPLPRGYWLALNNATSQWQLYASSNLLASGPAGATTNVWHNLRLAMQGTSLSCYVDNALVTNVTDNTYASGMAGLGCGGWHGAQFDNFILRQLHNTDFDLALAAAASASSVWQNDPTYAASMANDGNPNTRWNTAYPMLPNEWLELDWPAPVTFNHTDYSQYSSRIFGYQIQHWNGSGWTVDVNGGTMGAYASDTFPTVTSTKVRLVLTNFTSAPFIYEFYVYDDAPSNTAPAAAIFVNEWMIDNTHTLADPANGQFVPWFDLYNGGPTNVNLAGYYLSSSPTNLFQFQIPSGYSRGPSGFLLVWADGLIGQNSGSDLHVNFSLQLSQIIGLSNNAGQILDAVDLIAQPANVSSGSNPDGNPAVLNLRVPTPHHSNDQIWALPPILSTMNGSMILNFTGFLLATNQILAANSLQNPAWMNLATVFSDGLGAFNYTDTNAPGLSQRFYRAASP